MSKNLEKFCLIVIRWGSYLILFTPLLLIRQTLFPFIFGKIVVFRILVEIIAAVYLLLIIYRPQYRPRWNGLTIAVTIFIFVLIFTSLVGLDIQRSFWSSQERMTGILTMIHFWLWLLIITSLVKEWKEWRKMITLTLVASFLVALYALGQKLGLKYVIHAGDIRLSSTIGNADFTATYLMVHLFLAAFLILREKKVIAKILLGLLILFETIIIYFTATRGAFLALSLSIFIFLIFGIFYLPKKKLKSLALVLLIVIISAGVFLRFGLNQPYFKKLPFPIQRFAGISLTERDAVARFKAWGVGIRAWQERPIFGWGWENYNLAYNKHFTASYYLIDPAGSWYDRAHNAFLDTLVMGGLLGLLSYLAIYAIIFLLLFKKIRGSTRIKTQINADKDEHRSTQIRTQIDTDKKNSCYSWSNSCGFAILGLMFFAYFIQNNFVFDTPATLVIFYFGLGLVYFATKGDTNYELHPNDTNKKTTQPTSNQQLVTSKQFPFPILIFLIVIFLPWAIYKFNLEPWQVSKTAVIAITTSEVDLKSGLYWYKKALAKPLFVNPEIRLQLNKTVIEQLGKPNMDEKVFKDGLEFSLTELEKSTEEHPFDARYYLYLGQLYNITSSYNQEKEKDYLNKALENLVQAKKLAPQRLQIYYELTRNKILTGDFSAAIENAKQAVNLNEQFAETHWNLGLTYLTVQKYESGIQEIEKATQLGYYYYNRPDITLFIADAYAMLNKWEEAIYQTRVIIGQDPSNIDAYIKQAIYWARSENKNMAIIMAKKILEIKPDLAPQVEKFIQEIENQ